MNILARPRELLNRDYLINQGQSGTTKFGFELGYDKTTNNSSRNFTAVQYNGNITGMVWKSDGDDVRRKYDFTYDAVNRFMKGAFEQDNATSTWNNTVMNYTVQMGNGADPATAYDANGNIKAMTQYGWKLGVSTATPIDNLTYNYSLNTNRLLNVIDANNVADTKLGDFRTSLLSPNQSKNASTVDYTYDGNGNLKKDLNKDIGTAAAEDIVYNHLNLPSSITVRTTGGAVKGTIAYTYDATGNKLEKRVTEGTALTVTTYLGSAVYQARGTTGTPGQDTLQFISHEEGRMRVDVTNTTTPNPYEYFIKDHLGNVRMVLTDEVKQDIYPAATLEGSTTVGALSMVNYEKQFYTIDNTKIVSKPWTSTTFDYLNNNGVANPYPAGYSTNINATSLKVYQLNATTNTIANKTGLGIVLKVMAGDNINIFGKSYHKKPNGPGYGGTTNAILVSELINAFASYSIVNSKGVTGTQITGQAGFPTTMTGLIGSQPSQSGSRPKAAINWIVFDEQFKWVSGGFDMVGNAADNGLNNTITTNNGTLKTHNLSTIPTINIPKSGYIYVYCSNESKYNVFFDNLQLIHTRGPILEESHYYMHGTVQAGISSRALSFGLPENKKKYQQYEFNNDFDINLYETFYRSHDPQIGRFWQIDPSVDVLESYSPYETMGNNPISNVDPLGDFKTRFGAWWHKLWHGGGKIGQNEFEEWYVNKVNVSIVDGNTIATFSKYYGKGRSATTAAGEYWRDQVEMRMDIERKGERSIYKEYKSQKEASEATLQMGVGTLLPNVIKGITGAVNAEKIAETVTPITKNSVIEGYKVSNHAWRKSGLGRGATEELVSKVIKGAKEGGTVMPETGIGKFSGNAVNVYNHNNVKVVVDETNRVIMSIRPETGFKLK